MLVGSSLCGLPIAWLLRTVYLICYGTLGRRRYTSRSERITQAELRSFAVFSLHPMKSRHLSALLRTPASTGQALASVDMGCHLRGILHRMAGCVVIATALGLSGCVERRLFIRSNPPGAMVYVDDYQIGPTPIATSFTYYGTRKIRLVKDGYQTLTVYEKISPPWYEVPPFDFFSENLTTQQMRDMRVLEYQLQPMPIAPTPQLLQRAEELRRQTGNLPPLPAAGPAGQALPGPVPAENQPAASFPAQPIIPPPGSTIPPGGAMPGEATVPPDTVIPQGSAIYPGPAVPQGGVVPPGYGFPAGPSGAAIPSATMIEPPPTAAPSYAPYGGYAPYGAPAAP